MSILYWSHPGTRLKTFSAATRQTSRGTESTLKVELITRDPYDLGELLRQLSQAQAEQDAAEPPPAKAAKTLGPSPRIAKAKELLALPAPPRQIPYFKDEP
ncbi:hypothetical protein FB480_103427 [Agrobacterium vitis]|nr:hypothetical protein FB480_103427 [Agrobacterium vitis]